MDAPESSRPASLATLWLGTGTHNVHQSGKSFYGWALAFSGLAPPPKGRAVDACACDIGAETVSLPWVLRGVPALEAGAT